jgi:hypothetical protein
MAQASARGLAHLIGSVPLATGEDDDLTAGG